MLAQQLCQLSYTIIAGAMDVSFGYGGSPPTWQDAVKQVSQYDLVFPVAQVWAAFSKD